MIKGTATPIYGADIPPKETTATTKVRLKLLVKVKGKTYYDLKITMAKCSKIWIGGKHSNALADCNSILRQIPGGEK